MNLLVGRNRIIKRKTIRDKLIHSEPAGLHRGKNGFKVPLLRPPHVPKRIIPSPLLVALIIAARTVGTRNLEGDFLLVEIAAAQVQVDHTHKDNPPAFPAALRRLVDDLIFFGGGRNENAVDALSTAPGGRRGNGTASGGNVHGLGAKGFG